MSTDRWAINAELKVALDGIPPEYRPSAIFDFGDLPGTRQRFADLYRLAFGDAPPSSTVTAEDVVIPTPDGVELTVRTYRPRHSGEVLPCLYWTHGGGMVVGSPRDDDAKLHLIVESVGCAVAAIDYRLAPENPYPIPMEDCYAGLDWVATNAAELRIDGTRLAIGGMSAGGGLAAATALMARDRGGPNLVFQMLLTPMLDDRCITPSSQEVTDLTIWDRDLNLAGWRALLGELSGAQDLPPYASPGRVFDLSRLPPTFIDVGTLEVFRDEAIDYAVRLLRSGVETELHVFPGACHGYDQFAPDAQLSRSTQGLRVAALRRAFALGDGR